MKQNTAETQLTLRLSPQDIYRLDNYLFISDETASVVQAFCETAELDFLYLAGEGGSGKTHLLLACAEAVQKGGKQVIYLSLSELMHSGSPAILQSLEQVDLLCLDDIEAVAGNVAWEEALFHCFNRLHDAKGKLLVASANTPAHSLIKLPDLRSRLATGLVYQLPVLNDEQKQRALIIQAHYRGLSMSDEAAQYLLRHYGRDMNNLIQVLQQLDKASLQAKRKLTIPFIKQVLISA